MTPITSGEETVVIAAPIRPQLRGGEVLALRLTVSYIDELLTLAGWMAQQQAAMPVLEPGVYVYALGAVVYLAKARCWLLVDLSLDDFPEEGTLLRPAPAEPIAVAGSWSHDYRLFANGELEIARDDGAAWCTVFLPAIREQLR